MVEICKFCTNEAKYIVQTEQKIRNGMMKEIFSICKECYMVLAKTPLSNKEIEKLR